MAKKIIGFLLLIAIIFSVSLTGFSVLAESSDDLVETNLVMNGDMEWLGTSYNRWTGTHAPETEIVHGGDKSMKLSIDAERPIYLQSGNGIVAGETYTLSYWIYAEECLEKTYVLDGKLQDAGAGAKIEIAGTKVDSSGNVSSATIVDALEIYNPTEDELGTWVQRTISVDVPENGYTKNGYSYYPSGAFTLHIRPQGTGTIWYDDITFIGKTTFSYAASLSDKKARYQEGYDVGQSLYKEYVDYASSSELASGALNLFKNPGFEDLNTTYTTQLSSGQSGRNENGEYYITKDGSFSEISGALGWNRSNYLMDNSSKYPNCTEKDYEVIYRDDTVYHSDTASMKIHVPSGYPSGLNKPYAMAQVINGVTNCGEAFVGGAEYVLSTWIKTENVPVGGGAFFKIECKGSSVDYLSSEERFTDGQWHQINFVFKMPENTSSLNIYARLDGTGTVWYDDFVLGRSNSNDYIDFGSKHTFYYTDEPEIEAWTDFKTDFFNIESGSKVKFSLLDENGTEVSSCEDDTAEHNSWVFGSSKLEKKQAPYILKAEYILANGTVMDSHSKRIYLYDRPTSMGVNGNIYDTETGEVIPPFFMYGATSSTLDDMAETGLEVVRIKDMSLELDDVQRKLDAAHARGMKVLVALYGNYVAGHPAQIDTTRNVVSRFYTHPAVVAWMLMDEPSLNVTSHGIRTYEEVLYYLEEGYKAVRDIDPIHPVYIIEAAGSTNDSYERTGQLCDIFAIDPYPASLKDSIGGSLERATQRAINAVYSERPVWVLGIAANWGGTYANPVTSSMLRYQLYDALWAGANGSGHYLENDPSSTNPTFTETYLSTFRQAEASGEIDEIFDHFSLGNSPVFAKGSGDGYQWRSWSKDNGDIYIAVRSKISDSGDVLETVEATFKLESSDGTSIDGFTATLVNGTSEPTVTSLSNEFSCKITKGEVSLYKITKGYTLSNLTTSSDDSSVTVKYDVVKNLIDGGTVIYSFYDAQGRLLEMKKGDTTEAAELEKPQATITKTLTFDKKIDFASMKVFIWNSVTGMTPLSNMIEFIKE